MQPKHVRTWAGQNFSRYISFVSVAGLGNGTACFARCRIRWGWFNGGWCGPGLFSWWGGATCSWWLFGWIGAMWLGGCICCWACSWGRVIVELPCICPRGILSRREVEKYFIKKVYQLPPRDKMERVREYVWYICRYSPPAREMLRLLTRKRYYDFPHFWSCIPDFCEVHTEESRGNVTDCMLKSILLHFPPQNNSIRILQIYPRIRIRAFHPHPYPRFTETQSVIGN